MKPRVKKMLEIQANAFSHITIFEFMQGIVTNEMCFFFKNLILGNKSKSSFPCQYLHRCTDTDVEDSYRIICKTRIKIFFSKRFFSFRSHVKKDENHARFYF